VSPSSLRAGSRAPKAIIGKAVQKIAKGDLRPILRSNARKPVRAFASADAATNADHDEGVMRKTILRGQGESYSGVIVRIAAT
jgi:hypothetical protein